MISLKQFNEALERKHPEATLAMAYARLLEQYGSMFDMPVVAKVHDDFFYVHVVKDGIVTHGKIRQLFNVEYQFEGYYGCEEYKAFWMSLIHAKEDGERNIVFQDTVLCLNWSNGHVHAEVTNLEVVG